MKRNRGIQGIVLVLILSLVLSFLPAYAEQKEVVSLEVVTEQTIKEYCVDDTFNSRGLSLLVNYSDEDSKIITSGYRVEYDFSTIGTKKVEIFYTEGEKTVSTTINVRVMERPVLATENISAKEGDSFELPVKVSKNCGLMGMDLLISYDEKTMEPVSVTNNGILKDNTVEDGIATRKAGEFHIVWSGTEAISEDGTICTITFNCLENSDEESTKINIHAIDTNTYTEKYSPVSMKDIAATIKINSTNRVGKKALSNLSVTKADWVEGGAPSVVSVMGNDGKGDCKITYSNSVEGPYEVTEPKQAGNYFVKVFVEETEQYNSGSAIAAYSIWRAEDVKNKNNNIGTTTTPNTAGGTSTVTGNNTKVESTNTVTATNVLPQLTVPKIKSVKNKKGRKIVLKMKKLTGNPDGYEISYSTKKKSKNYNLITDLKTSKINYTFKVSQKKKYYVRVRSFAKKDGAVYYSAWSSLKTIKVKK